MNHGKHVTREKFSTSRNLNICNILLHGKTTIVETDDNFVFSNMFCCVIILLMDYVVMFSCVQKTF
jgi:hypothetical protein